MICSVCEKPKATLQCQSCECSICKSCALFLEEGTFSFLPVIPKVLQGGAYCPTCYDSKVAPELETYEQDIERAKDVIVFFKKQTKETRHVKRLEIPVVVRDCPDREETLLRLGYLAFKAGYSAMVDVEVTSEKIRNGSRQHSNWKGVGVPAEVDLSKIPKDRSIRFNPN